jgi:beta-glucosidase
LNPAFRDLNKNGRLDPYEDPRRPVEERVEDLLSQMTVEEKAGMMFHAMIGMNPDGSLVEGESQVGSISTSAMVLNKMMNTFNVLQGIRPG